MLRQLIVICCAIVAVTSSGHAQCEFARLHFPGPKNTQGNLSAQFGFNLAVDGDHAIISSRRLNGDDPLLHFFHRDGDGWRFLSNVTPLDPNGDIGINLAIHGNLALATDSRFDSGFKELVRVFEFVEGAWTESEPVEWPSAAAVSNLVGITTFGTQIATDGATVAVSVPTYPGTNNTNGAIFTYERMDDRWNLTQTITPEPGGILLGISLDVQDDVIVATSKNFSATVFRRTENTWTLFQTLSTNGIDFRDIQIHGNRIFVPVEGIGDSPNYIRVFRDFGPGWIHEQDIDAQPGQLEFAEAMDIQDDTIITSTGVENAELVVLRRQPDDAWIQTETLTAGLGDFPSTVYDLGRRIAITNDGMLASAPRWTDPTVTNAPMLGLVLEYRGFDDTDCDRNGIPDSCDTHDCTALDDNANGILDRCETNVANFIGPAHGNWNDPAHWSTGTIPDASTTVVLTQAVALTAPSEAGTVRIVCEGALDLNAQTIAANIDVDEGTLIGPGMITGNLTNRALLQINSGSLAIDGAYQQTNAGEVHLIPGDARHVPVLQVSSAVDLAGRIVIDASTLSTRPGSTVDMIRGDTVTGAFDSQFLTADDDRQFRVTTSNAAWSLLVDERRPVETCTTFRQPQTFDLISLDDQRLLIGTDTYTLDNNEWTFDESIQFPEGDQYGGRGVAINGDRAALARDSANIDVYVRTDRGWTLEDTITNPIPDTNLFGDFNLRRYRIALDDDVMVISAIAQFYGSRVDGAAVYRRTGSTWTRDAILRPPATRFTSQYGVSVAIHNERIVIGSEWIYQSSSRDCNVPAPPVDIYEYDGTDWIRTAELTNALPLENCICSEFGTAVAIHDDIIAVHSERCPPVFAGWSQRVVLQIFRHVNDQWKLEGVVDVPGYYEWWIPPPVMAMDEHSILFSSVGVEFADTPGRVGAVHIVQHNGDMWVRNPATIRPGPCEQQFGYIVDVSGDNAAIISVNGVNESTTLVRGILGIDLDRDGIADSCADVDEPAGPPFEPCPVGNCREDCSPVTGDNTYGNGVVNVDDLIEVIQLTRSFTTLQRRGDVNLDGAIDALDIQLVIDAMLNNGQCP
ncbi:MAG: hypothetical protein AAF432_07300 [Planctomycetota bacterium]